MICMTTSRESSERVQGGGKAATRSMLATMTR